MSEAKNLRDVLRGAPEVVIPATGSRMLYADADGYVKRSTGVPSFALGLPTQMGTWLRIGQSEAAHPGFALFVLAQPWQRTLPGVSMIAAMLEPSDYNANKNYGSVIVIAGAKAEAYPKARIVVPAELTTGKPSYLDVFLNSIFDNERTKVTMISSANFLVNIEANAEIPEGYTTVEFDLTVGGGVNGWLTTYCNLRRKGGQRDGRSETSNKRPSEGSDARRYGIPGCLSRSRYVYRIRYLYHRRNHTGNLSPTYGIISSICNTGSNKTLFVDLPSSDFGAMPYRRKDTECFRRVVTLERGSLSVISAGKEVAA